MNLLTRYIIFEIIKCFFMALICVLTLFIAIDFLNYMDKFIEANLSMWRALQYVLYKIPFIFSQGMPVVLLMAILIVFGLMSKNKELVAVNAGGISIYALIKPVIIVCATLSLIIFIIAEHVAPNTMLIANTIRYQELRKSANVSKKKKNIWIKGYRKITHIKYFDPASQAIFGYTRYHFDEQFRLAQRVDARKGVYQDGQWELADGMVQVLNEDSTYSTTFYKTRKEKLELHPQDFKRIVRQSTEMNYAELRDYVQKIEREGYDSTVYKVDLYAKSAYPFVCIIMGLIGIGLSAKRNLSSGIPLSITYGLVIGFCFWIFQSFCLSLGYGGLLPPWAAAWLANFIFLCCGLLLVLYAE